MRSFLSISPIILAAGDSSRMGYPKALLPIGEDTFLTRILKIIRKVGLASPTIILGRSAGIIQPGIKDWATNVRINSDPSRGQLSSIQLGLSSLHSSAQAAMIWPVDQPAISEDLVRSLAQVFVQSQSLIAFPKYADKRGHPAIFHRALFREFMDTPLAEGPKNILLRHEKNTAVLPTVEVATVQDIDTPAEYKSLTGKSIEDALARKFPKK
jgi:molybdenum cofactor cytidylyltransferase